MSQSYELTVCRESERRGQRLCSLMGKRSRPTLPAPLAASRPGRFRSFTGRYPSLHQFHAAERESIRRPITELRSQLGISFAWLACCWPTFTIFSSEC